MKFLILLFITISSVFGKYSSLIEKNHIDLTGHWLASIEYQNKKMWEEKVLKDYMEDFISIDPFFGIGPLVDKRVDEDNKKSDLISSVEYAWFIKKFEVPKNWTGKSILLNLGKGNWSSEIWFNGKPINPLKIFKASNNVLKIQRQEYDS